MYCVRRTATTKPDEVDADSLPAEHRDLLAQICYLDRPFPLGWMRPPLGTDSPAFAATLAHARETVRELYESGLIFFSVAVAVDATDVTSLLAEDRYWATWCNDIAVHLTPAGDELV